MNIEHKLLAIIEAFDRDSDQWLHIAIGPHCGKLSGYWGLVTDHETLGESDFLDDIGWNESEHAETLEDLIERLYQVYVLEDLSPVSSRKDFET